MARQKQLASATPAEAKPKSSPLMILLLVVISALAGLKITQFVGMSPLDVKTGETQQIQKEIDKAGKEVGKSVDEIKESIGL